MIAGRRPRDEFQQVKFLICQRIEPSERRPHRRQEIPTLDGKIGEHIVVVVSKILFVKNEADIKGQKDQKYEDGYAVGEIEAPEFCQAIPTAFAKAAWEHRLATVAQQ